jgi:hypothetical protein
LLVLPEDGKGLVYSRNWITAYSRKRGDVRHWQIDDDIMFVMRMYRGARLYCVSNVAIAAMEDFVDRYENVALASPNSEFFVPESGIMAKNWPPFFLNHRCYTFILFTNRVPCDWRPPNNEDADMSLQVLAEGWCKEGRAVARGFLLVAPPSKIVCLGKSVGRCFGVKDEFFTLTVDEGHELLIFPHPSGINRWWNDSGNRARAKRSLRRFCRNILD